MKWELGALKILARNQTVPGVALADAVSEIENLNKRIAAYQVTLKALRMAGDGLIDLCATEGYDSTNSEAIDAWYKAQGV